MATVSVMFFMPVLDGGGAEMNAVRLAEGLLRCGVRPTYVVGRGPGRYADLLPAAARVVVLETGGIESSTVRMIRSIRPLATLIDAERPDCLCPVLHTPSFVAVLARKLAHHKPRIALSVQNTLAPPESADRRFGERVEDGLVRWLFPQADHVIALSRGVADDVARAIPALRGRIDVVHNAGLPLPAQLAVPEPDPPLPRTSRLRFLACGRLTEQKGYPYLLAAFAKLGDSLDAELHILGDGAQRARLERMCRELGIGDRVTFLGFRRNPYVHMREADVFVLSSLWEGFANVVVEAMAMALPVIATDCPHGPAEIITPGHDGVLVPPADADALAAAMRQLAVDADFRRRLAEHGCLRARDFDAESIGAQYAGIFARLAGQQA